MRFMRFTPLVDSPDAQEGPVGHRRLKRVVLSVCLGMAAAVPLTWVSPAGAATAVDNCTIVSPTDLSPVFGVTYGTGTPLTTPGPANNILRASGFPETGCVFTTPFGAVAPGTVLSTVAIDAVPGKAGAAAYKRAQKELAGEATALKGVGKKAFSVPTGPSGVEVYAWAKPGFVRLYASADRYESGGARTSIVTPTLAGQAAGAALGNL